MAKWRESNLRANSPVAPGPGKIAAVSRMSNTMDVFWVGPDGSINNTRWYDLNDRQWESDQLFSPGTASAAGGIAAITRAPGTIEIFWVGPTGTVQQARWVDEEQRPGGAWEIFTVAPVGSASTTSGIAAVSRRPDTKEVFWAAPDATLRNAHWYDSGNEWNFAALSENVAVDTHISAVARNADNLDVVYSQVFTIEETYDWVPIYEANPYYNPHKVTGHPAFDDDGQPSHLPTGEYYPKTRRVQRYSLVISRWSDDTKNQLVKGIWQTETLYYTQILTAAAAVCHNPHTIEIFYAAQGIALSPALHHSFWYDGSASWQHRVLTPPGEISTSAGITAAARKSGTIEVMWISPEGTVHNAYWYEGRPWITYHQTEMRGAASTGDITLISRIPESLEAFWVDWDGKLVNRHWYE